MTRYELIERIGAGGMAEIFRGKAIAAGGFEKPVAIKRILPHLSQDRRFVELLIAEANILSHLRHRNIVQIFDVGLGDDGQYFLVMEYVDGADLGALQRKLEARRQRLPIELALHMGAEVCEALEHAHSARGPDQRLLRIVHRDVSPSNVLISRAGEVKLTDFGIAKRPEEVTGHGGVRGKFAYISPEQAMNTHVDARSDVYSLGIVIYEMVVGARLFSHLPDFDALRAVREGYVRPPREVDPAVTPEVEEILMKALAHDPAKRFTGAGELGARLRGVRYAMESSGDPAKEMAQILIAALEGPDPAPAPEVSPTRAARAPLREQAARDDSRDDTWQGRESRSDLHEPTVVRIHTAAGFTTTGTDVLATDTASFLKAKILLDAFEEEETQAVSGIPQGMRDELSGGKPLGKRRPWAQDTSEEQTRLVEARRGPRTGALSSSPPPTPSSGPKGTPPSPKPKASLAAPSSPIAATRLKPVSPGQLPPPAAAAAVPARAATPTIRELFHRGALLDRDGTTLPGSTRTPADARRRRWILLAVTAAIVALVSFLIARIVLGGASPKPAGAPLDAGAGAAFDASAETAPGTDAGATGAGSAAATTPDAAAKPAAKKPPKKKPPAKKPPAKKPPAKKPPAKSR